MSIEALLMYGSRARGDFEKISDVDLFAITSEDYYGLVAQGNVNVVHYSMSHAVERAKSGDLFFLHLVSEARIVYDKNNIFDFLKKSFVYKKNYSDEVLNAVNLAWFLIECENSFLNYTLFNKRIAWCVRTILIAKSAEARTPVFSARELSKFSEAPYVSTLIANKDSDIRNISILKKLKEFLNFWSFLSPFKGKKTSAQDYATLFFATNNEIGIKTMSSLAMDQDFIGYGIKKI